MSNGFVDYPDGADICEAYVARPAAPGPAAAVLVAHNWAGHGDPDRAAADRLAALGFTGIALDVYGKGRRGDLQGDNSHLMNPWLADRSALRRRLLAAVDMAAALPGVDPARIGVIGYCFGGLCALDLARSADPRVRAAVSIHGIFAPPGLGAQPPISARVLVLHGWRDPMAPPTDVLALAEELGAAQADWELTAYGRPYHAFTAPLANAPERGLAYDAAADRRSWASLASYLTDALA